jgi:hypothetical protein
LINKNRSNQLCKIISNHQMYPWITKDIQESSHKLKRSKTLKKLNQIKSDSINLHENIVALQWWCFILNLSWKTSYTWLWKINPKLKKSVLYFWSHWGQCVILVWGWGRHFCLLFLLFLLLFSLLLKKKIKLCYVVV